MKIINKLMKTSLPSANAGTALICFTFNHSLSAAYAIFGTAMASHCMQSHNFNTEIRHNHCMSCTWWYNGSLPFDHPNVPRLFTPRGRAWVRTHVGHSYHPIKFRCRFYHHWRLLTIDSVSSLRLSILLPFPSPSFVLHVPLLLYSFFHWCVMI